MRPMNTPTAIVQALISMGMTQMAISRETGISQPKLSRWAAGVVTSSAQDAITLQRFHDRQLATKRKPRRKPRAKAAA